MAFSRPAAAPVVPNASVVEGKLLKIIPEPDGNGEVWDVAVERAAAAPPLPNFAQPYEGKTVQVYVHPDFKHSLQANDPVEARVAYRGDERGGRFVLQDDAARKL
jgi:hypothetical protein